MRDGGREKGVRDGGREGGREKAVREGEGSEGMGWGDEQRVRGDGVVGTDGRRGLREGERVVGTGGGGGRGARPRRCSLSCRSRRVGSWSCPPSLSSLCPRCASSSCPPSVFSSFGRRASLSFCAARRCRIRVFVIVIVAVCRRLIVVWCSFHVVGVMVHVVVALAVWWCLSCP